MTLSLLPSRVKLQTTPLPAHTGHALRYLHVMHASCWRRVFLRTQFMLPRHLNGMRAYPNVCISRIPYHGHRDERVEVIRHTGWNSRLNRGEPNLPHSSSLPKWNRTVFISALSELFLPVGGCSVVLDFSHSLKWIIRALAMSKAL